MDRGAAAELLSRLHREQNASYAGADASGLRSLLREDIVWHVPDSNPIAGHFHGIDDVFDYFIRRRGIAGTPCRCIPASYLSATASIASLTDGTATIGGVSRCWSTVGLYRIVDGQIA